MIKCCFLWGALIASCSVYAKNVCSDVYGDQVHAPLITKEGAVCFIRRAIVDDKTGSPVGLDGISLFYIKSGGVPVEAKGRGLLYDDTPGEIVDAFLLRSGRDRRKKIYVIHYFDVRNSLVEKNSSGKFYSVYVFESVGGVLRQDERATDWFGANYSWLSDGERVVYRFPYQYRKDVESVVNSPLALLMEGTDGVRAKVKRKAYLFNESRTSAKTNKYLIAGDRVMVERTTAGWCKIDYRGSKVPIKMWLICAALDVGAGVDVN